MPAKNKVFVGSRYGYLVVQCAQGKSSQGETLWLCNCDCGSSKVVRSYSLTSGKTKSCGCWKSEKARTDSRTHGLSKSSTYSVWCGLISRCTKPTAWAYKDYGGRGITVCERWLKFENFLADMGVKPEGKTLDRRDNNGNYEPGNCRWATRKEQANNRRSSRHITLGGKTMTLVKWSEDKGISQDKIRNRIDYLGWSVEKALTTP